MTATAMCSACYLGRCEDCPGCWHEIEHDFSDWHAVDDTYESDRATRRYEDFYDRMFGDCA